MSKSRILVLGANGYIGRHVVKALDAEGHPMQLADLGPAALQPGHPYTPVDATRPDGLEALVGQCDAVLHLAGRSGTWNSFEEHASFMSVNEIGLVSVLEAIRRTQRKIKIVFPSSRLVYRGVRDTPLSEDAVIEPRTIYAMSKWACEQYLRMYRRVFDIPYAIIRICVPYGNVVDDALSYGTLAHMINPAASGKPVTVFGDGSQKRSFIHAEDLAHLLVHAINSDSVIDDTFNLGGPDACSVRDVAEMVATAYGVPVQFAPWPANLERIESGDTIFDSTRLMSILPYTFRHRLPDWAKGMGPARKDRSP